MVTIGAPPLTLLVATLLLLLLLANGAVADLTSTASPSPSPVTSFTVTAVNGFIYTGTDGFYTYDVGVGGRAYQDSVTLGTSYSRTFTVSGTGYVTYTEQYVMGDYGGCPRTATLVLTCGPATFTLVSISEFPMCHWILAGTAAECCPPTPTPTATAMATGTGTATVTITASFTPSGSLTGSFTPSGSLTGSLTPSASPTGSLTPSASSTASPPPTSSNTPSASVSPTPSLTSTASSTTSATAPFTPSPTASLSPTASDVPVLAAAGSSTNHPDMFAAALALGLVAVAFILTLFFCRNVPCFCCRRRARAPPSNVDADAVEGAAKKKRTVVSAVGTEGAVAAPATTAGFVV